MCRSADRDRGFSLIEIVVALGVLSTVLVALLPQLVVGIRSTGTARYVSQAKGVAQGELERMRNLPFHITPAAGDYVDVLDYYFPDDDAPAVAPTCEGPDTYVPPQAGWSGFVAGGSAARCDYEPSGPFFRTVKVVAPQPGIGQFVVVANTQFLSSSTPPVPVAPLSGYDTQDDRYDSPASTQIGVTLTVLFAERGTLRPVTTYTQISQQLPNVSRLRSEVDVRVLEVGSVTADGVPLSAGAGLASLRGAVSYGSTARTDLSAVNAGLATGEQDAGASLNTSAPPAAVVTGQHSAAGSLDSFGCVYACWGTSSLSGFDLTADEGLPNAGTPTAPVQALVTGNSNGVLTFGNSTAGNYRSDLGLVTPLVGFDTAASAVPSGITETCTAATTGPGAFVSAGGFLRTTAGDTGLVESCGVARATTVELFPTSFAPDGVVQVVLERASARCVVQGSAHAATVEHDYRAVVRYLTGTPSTYTEVIVSPTSNDLAAVDLAADRAGGLYKLSDYIVSWTGLTATQVRTTASGGVASVTLPGVLTIATVPVRGTVQPAPASPSPSATASPTTTASPTETVSPTATPSPTPVVTVDPTSVLSLTVGAVSCTAEDLR
ncbi:MAG TPA: type II secretion system protein [Nocardioidaceae bacterium]|nr:type II secretion system protein [Nocardioidaceae bacterium]